MQSLKIRVELNRGRHGIAVKKFSDIAGSLSALLSKISEDLDLNDEKWVAVDFKNGSVSFTLEKQSLEDDAFERGKAGFRALFNNETNSPIYHRLRASTRLQYASIGKQIEPDEVVAFGLFRNGEVEPAEGFTLTRAIANDIESHLARRIKYHGEIQGVVHAFFKEAKPQYLKVRQLSTDELVTCFFPPQMYHAAVETMAIESTVIFVEGEITEWAESGQIESIDVSDFYHAPDFDLQFHHKFIGSKPGLTGKKTAEEFIQELRAHA